MFKPVGGIYSKPGKDQSLVENKSQGHLGVDCRMTAMEQINAVNKVHRFPRNFLLFRENGSWYL